MISFESGLKSRGNVQNLKIIFSEGSQGFILDAQSVSTQCNQGCFSAAHTKFCAYKRALVVVAMLNGIDSKSCRCAVIHVLLKETQVRTGLLFCIDSQLYAQNAT